MSYPLSSAVSVGDATEASQYNNLRRDALYLGGDPAGSGTLLQLLIQGMGAVDLTRVSGTVIRLNASEAAPCALMISGQIYAVTEALTITLSAVDLTAAGRYYLFAAAQSDGSFILDAGQNTTMSGGRAIGSFLWDGSGIVPGTLHNYEVFETIREVKKPSIANGRLTLASGIPVPEVDVTAANELYFTPYGGNEIGLLVGGEWEVFTFSELSLSLSGMTNELPYDIFLSATADGLQLSAAAWGSAAARLTPLVYTDGVKVSSADYGKRYLGSIVLNAAGKGEDSAAGRLLWNEYNRVERPMLAQLATAASPTAVTNAWVPVYGADAPTVRLLVPGPDAAFELCGAGTGQTITENDIIYGRTYMFGIGRDIAWENPYTGNASCVPVCGHDFGNGPEHVSIRNFGAAFTGYHAYTLIFYTNFTFTPDCKKLTAAGECAGLYGSIRG